MYVDRIGVDKLKEKSDIRQKITYPEYVNAYLAILRDRASVRDADRVGLIEHLSPIVTGC